MPIITHGPSKMDHSDKDGDLVQPVYEKVILFIVNGGHDKFWDCIQKKLSMIHDNIRFIIIKKRSPIEYDKDQRSYQRVSIKNNGEEQSFMFQFSKKGGTGVSEISLFLDPDHKCNVEIPSKKIGPDGITPAGMIQFLDILNRIYHDQEFFPAEFHDASMTVDTLCDAITTDLKQSFGHDLKTIDDLNILLTIPELYDQYRNLKPLRSYSQKMASLVSETEEWRQYDLFSDHIMEKNRLLIEEIYPNLTPRYSKRKMIFADKYFLKSATDNHYVGSVAYYVFIESDESTLEELEDLFETLNYPSGVESQTPPSLFVKVIAYCQDESLQASYNLFMKYGASICRGESNIPQDQEMDRYLKDQLDGNKGENIDNTIKSITAGIINELQLGQANHPIRLTSIISKSFFDASYYDNQLLFCSDVSPFVTVEHHYYHDLQSGRKHIDEIGTDILVVEEDIPNGNILDLIPEMLHREDGPQQIIVLTEEGSSKPNGMTKKYNLVQCAKISHLTGDISKDFFNIVYKALGKAQDRRMKILQYGCQSELEYFKKKYGEKIKGIKGLMDCLRIVDDIATYNIPILIEGESGTGKELIAECIHIMSNRHGEFKQRNCALYKGNEAISEYFGHVKGAFTDAVEPRAGVFEEADRGTVLLDEIGDMQLDLQAKLLRVIQDKTVLRMGGNEPIKVDFRIISSTNKDLERMVEQKTFRGDLYARINQAYIKIPPLSDRKEDIPELANYFVSKFAKNEHKSPKIIDPRTMALLTNYNWPYNVRQLETVVNQAFVKAGPHVSIKPYHLPEVGSPESFAPTSSDTNDNSDENNSISEIKATSKAEHRELTPENILHELFKWDDILSRTKKNYPKRFAVIIAAHEMSEMGIREFAELIGCNENDISQVRKKVKESIFSGKITLEQLKESIDPVHHGSIERFVRAVTTPKL